MKKSNLTLVLGGTGKTGSRIAGRLTSVGVPVRIGSRRQELSFSWDDSSTWPQVLEDVANIYISFAPDLAVPGASEAIRKLTQMAVESGVKRIVLLSGRGEKEAQLCETLIQRDDVEWTVVRASWFAQNFSEGAFAEMIMEGNVFLPAGDVKEPFVDADDIADVAVAALTENGHAGKIYEVTGTRLLSFAEAVNEIASAMGQKIHYQQIPMEDFLKEASAAGIPDDYLWLLEYLFTTVLDGRNEYMTDGIQRALHRQPKDFSEFAENFAATINSDATAYDDAKKIA